MEIRNMTKGITATALSEFKKLLSKIPNDRFKNTWFIALRQNRKNPDCPGGTVLKGNTAYRLMVKDCITRLKWGKNIGIYAMSGGLMFLDLDVEKGKLKASEEFLQKITPSFCVKTRNGGMQYYYLNDGGYPNQIIKENGVDIGELRTDWYYVVGVGSYVIPDENNGNGDGTYRVINDATIAPFSGLDGYIEKRSEPQKDEVQIINKVTEVKKGVSIDEYQKKLKEQGKKPKKATESMVKSMLMELQRGM